MPTMKLGFQPYDLEVMVESGRRFWTIFKTTDGSTWAVGSQLQLVLSGTTWSATLSNDRLSFSFDVTAAQVTSYLSTAATSSAELVYTELGADPITIGKGVVVNG